MKHAHMFAVLAGFAVVAVAGWTARRNLSQSANMSTATIPKPAKRRIKAVPGNPFAGLEHLAGSVSLPTPGTSREKIRNRLKAKHHR
ncbi:hypothetical protein Ga0100230_004610 [Opitutaceae bacterium TAV3]|nr:hypothetical protein Ga0100230_004610 [Opitutaceae bacterium TAV3]